MKKAIFLDRDGVINRLVYNPATGDYGAPFCAKDLKIYPWVAAALKKLQEKGFLFFIVSNQPDYAKGYTSLKQIKEVALRLSNFFKSNGIKFRKYYYCFHHPQGKVKRYSFKCKCRKPKAFFLNEAKKKYSLDLANSWFIGDSDVDVFCGQAAKTRTILIEEERSRAKRGKSYPDARAVNLKEAALIIIKKNTLCNV